MATEDNGNGGRREIIEEIVLNLRPWSQGEKSVCRGVSHDLDVLRETVANAEANVHHTAKGKNAALQVRPSLTKLIRILREFPVDHPLFKELPSTSQKLLRQLKKINEICDHLANSRLPTKNADITKNFCAAFACGMISAFSKKKPTGTVDGPLRTISSLLYDAVTGKPEVDMKRACDLTLKVFKHAAERNKNKPITSGQSSKTTTKAS
jgi:hypothetical protein